MDDNVRSFLVELGLLLKKHQVHLGVFTDCEGPAFLAEDQFYVVDAAYQKTVIAEQTYLEASDVSAFLANHSIDKD